MTKLNRTHRRIVDAVIRKAEEECPGALALLGVYGSAATGDMHDKSDLDLLILINDERGYALCDTFVLDDAGVGYDLYCTGWDMLEEDALCSHAHLSKLLDSQIVYAPNPAATERLDGLRAAARRRLCSDERFEKAHSALDEAKKSFADCLLTDDLAAVRLHAGAAIYMLLDALMLHGGRYFKLGVKHTFEETAQLELTFDLEQLVLAVIRAETVCSIRSALRQLLKAAQAHFEHAAERKAPSGDDLRGTYEEMYSNWHGKMQEAANRGDVFSSFMNLFSMRWMLDGLAQGAPIGKIECMHLFDPHDLQANGRLFDETLEKYRAEREKAGVQTRRFADADAFCREYLRRSR